jgi:hypothetical protein
MNDLDFKHTVLDTLSDSFCAAKWYNATIWLGSGMTTSCHHPPAHLVDINKVRSNPKLLHNTDQKKADRAQMLKGERPAGCEYCWKIEDMGRDAVSDRVYKSRIYPIEALDEAYKHRIKKMLIFAHLKLHSIALANSLVAIVTLLSVLHGLTISRRNGPYERLGV